MPRNARLAARDAWSSLNVSRDRFHFVLSPRYVVGGGAVKPGAASGTRV